MQSKHVADITGYANSAASLWAAVDEVLVEMVPAPLGLQPNEYIVVSWTDRPYGELETLKVASVHDGSQIAVRLAWANARPESGAGEAFPDSAALAFPVRGDPELTQMGSPEAPIHALHWQARKNVIRSVLASGIGTSRSGPEVNQSISAGWSQGVWSVVFVRTLKSPEDGATLVPGSPLRIGFAVWNGSNQERAGIKAVSEDWIEFTLET